MFVTLRVVFGEARDVPCSFSWYHFSQMSGREHIWNRSSQGKGGKKRFTIRIRPGYEHFTLGRVMSCVGQEIFLNWLETKLLTRKLKDDCAWKRRDHRTLFQQSSGPVAFSARVSMSASSYYGLPIPTLLQHLLILRVVATVINVCCIKVGITAFSHGEPWIVDCKSSSHSFQVLSVWAVSCFGNNSRADRCPEVSHLV